VDKWLVWGRLWTILACGPRRDERGDVPGWVLVTIMTAGLVTMLWKFAGPQLQQMLSDALSQVSG
jgi:hypothetical protein